MVIENKIDAKANRHTNKQTNKHKQLIPNRNRKDDFTLRITSTHSHATIIFQHQF